MTTTKEKYKERPGDVVIDLGDGESLILNKMKGKRYFLEVNREVDKNSKPTGEYHEFCYDEDNKGIFKDSIKDQIYPYFQKVEIFMNQNKKVQSVKLEIRVQK